MANDTTPSNGTPTQGEVATIAVFGALAFGGIVYAIWSLNRIDAKAKATAAQRYQSWEAGKESRLAAMRQQAIADAAREAQFKASAAAMRRQQSAVKGFV